MRAGSLRCGHPHVWDNSFAHSLSTTLFVLPTVWRKRFRFPRLHWPSVHPTVWGKPATRHVQIRGSGSSPRGGENIFDSRSGGRFGSSHGCWKTAHVVFRPLPGSVTPRVWGKLGEAALKAVQNRFIPTGVGKTIRIWTWTISASVHPHGCGENDRRDRGAVRPLGSSPRVWGKPGQARRGRDYHRFIPTGVGKTHGTRPKAGAFTVHPHGCGENAFCRPKFWGIARFIPTGVGKTRTAFARS
jgi:hypothetical protein